MRVSASGAVTIDGTITANGGIGTENYSGGGSGGGVFITCSSISGRGAILAEGGNGSGVSSGGSGGGGRIAVVYDPAAQAAMPPCEIRFSVLPGTNRTNKSGGSTNMGDIGTVYLSDTQFLAMAISRGLNGQLAGLTRLTLGALTVSNAWIRFPESGLRLDVTGRTLVIGPNARLDIGGDTQTVNAAQYYLGPGITYCAGPTGPSVRLGGDLVVTNEARLFLHGAATNAANPVGADIQVAGSVIAAPSSGIHVVSHPFNGGYPRLRVGRLVVTPGGAMLASGRGYAAVDSVPANGPGRGGLPGGGGGHGGVGGKTNGGVVYGSATIPDTPGSAGSRGTVVGYVAGGPNGGGLLRVEAADAVVVDGLVAADGGSSIVTNVGAGSGGGIYIRCRSFSGGPDGRLSARGGSATGGNAGGGGGGRIAVWRFAPLDTFAGTISVDAGAGVSPPAGTGSVMRIDRPLPNSAIIVVQ